MNEEKELENLQEYLEYIEAEIDEYDKTGKADEVYLDLKREHYLVSELIQDKEMV
jgi:hypothetical protein